MQFDIDINQIACEVVFTLVLGASAMRTRSAVADAAGSSGACPEMDICVDPK